VIFDEATTTDIGSERSVESRDDGESADIAGMFSKGPKITSTQPSSIGLHNMTGRSSALTMYDYSISNNSTIDRTGSDLESVTSYPDDAFSQTETLPGLVSYQEAAAQYVVKVLVKDPELLSMYKDAIRKTRSLKIVKKHEKILHGFSLDLKDREQTHSETVVIRFLARQTRKTLISSEIYDNLALSEEIVIAKPQTRLDSEQPSIEMIARWFLEQDQTEAQIFGQNQSQKTTKLKLTGGLNC
jgi:predicted GIY-YIG superfamily endonuclease